MMRDRNMSSKHERQDSGRNASRSRDSKNNPESYKHILKERHYKDDDDRNKRKDKDHSNRDPKKSSKPHQRHQSHSPHAKSHQASSTKKPGSKPDSDRGDKSKKSRNPDESYEELSRRKRKLESELRALDLEEAAEKEAENKKICRDKHGKSSAKVPVPEVKIKRERHSDEEKEQHSSSSGQRSSSGRSAPRNERTEKRHSKDIKPDKRHPRDAHPVTVKRERERHRSGASESSNDSKGWGKKEPEKKPPEKEKPDFAPSGKLAEETNTYNGVVIKYNEPSEARKPKRRWRLYPFKGDSDLPFIPIHRQSAYLFGRTRLIADIPIDHPSCSKQHAVLQFRLVPYKRENGTTGRRVRPYIIDLESSNGTYVNNNRIDPRCYVELCEKDVIKFGYSSREYVILHEESKFAEEDDDVQDGETVN